jgi:hypothetical protein
VALARLLRRSPVMLRIPGTSSLAHFEENLGAARYPAKQRGDPNLGGSFLTAGKTPFGRLKSPSPRQKYASYQQPVYHLSSLTAAD